MAFWFTTSHGNTCHNQPGTPNYVKDEPPKYPLTSINYRETCLKDGFARIGYPNTGDLTNLCFERRLALDGYTFDTIETISHSSLTKRQLMDFSNILAGDFILIPADDETYDIHFGLVLTKEKKRVHPYITPRPKAYYYYYDISKGDYYECAHRLNVEWAKEENGDFAQLQVPEIGGVWEVAFSQLHKASEKLSVYVKKYDFW